MQSKDRTSQSGELIFCAAFFLMLCRARLYASTAVVYLDDYPAIGQIWRGIVYALILFKLFTQDRYSLQRLLLNFSLGILLTATIFFHRDYGILDLTAILLGAHGVPLKKSVAVFFYTVLFLTAFLMLLSLTGAIENFVTHTDDGNARYSFGAAYPTDFAATVFYLQLSAGYLFRKKYPLIKLLFWVGVSVFLYFFCHARLDCILIIAFALVMYLNACLPAFFRRDGVQRTMLVLVPALCLGSVLLHMLYSPNDPFTEKLNELLSGRLYYGNRALFDHGFSFFGADIPLQGNGFTTEVKDESLGYYFVDCGFLLIALKYGLVLLVVISAAFLSAMRTESVRSQATLSVIILFLALTSTVDHHLLEIGFDPFLLILPPALTDLLSPGSLEKRSAL